MRALPLSLVLILVAGCGPEAMVSGGWGGDEATVDAPLGTSHLRLMAGNLTSGNNQSYDPGEGMRILAGVKPDVAMLQEFNYRTNSDADFRSFVDQTFGTSFSYARGAPAQIPNGIISRYPIVESGDWVDTVQVSPNRAFTWAHIDLPGPHDLWAVSVHLLTKSAGARQDEAALLANDLKAHVPPGDWVVIAGDFNTSSRTEAALSTLSSVVVTSGPFPVDQAGNGNTNAARKNPYDWVVVSGGLNAQAVPTVIGSVSFTNGAVIDTRVFSPISDLAPALKGDSAATNMQHMGVVRDFQFVIEGGADAGGVDAGQADAGRPDAGTFDAGFDAGTFDAGFDAGPAPALAVTAPTASTSVTLGNALTVSWTSEAISSVDVDYAQDGVSFTQVVHAVAASAGTTSWVVTGSPTTTARIRVRDTAGAVSAVSAAFTVVKPVDPGKIIINEILANEPGSNAAGEFIELYNVGGLPVDVSGWSLSDATSVRHRFASGTTIAAGGTLVVYGAASGIPTGTPNAIGSSTGALSLNNSSDSVSLRDGLNAVVDSFNYGADLASTDGVSMNRSPDRSAAGTFVLHTTLSSLQRSPGVAVNGQP